MIVRSRGHTLLELLVALVVFALVAAAGYSGLNQMSRARAAAEIEADRLAQLQYTISRLEQDLAQTIDASWRSAAGQRRPALAGSAQELQLVHSGWFNPRGSARSELQPVRWQWQAQRLQRQTPLSEPEPSYADSDSQGAALEFTSLEFSYLDSNDQWQSRWPLAERTVVANAAANVGQELPRAVRVRLELAGFGPLERIVELPGPRS